DPLCGSMRINSRATAAFAHECMWAGNLDEARALLERAGAIAHDHGDVSAAAVLGYRAALEFFCDDWPRSLELTDELYEVGVESEFEPIAITALTARGLLFAHLGDEDRARREVRDALGLEGPHRGRFAARNGTWALALLELS